MTTMDNDGKTLAAVILAVSHFVGGKPASHEDIALALAVVEERQGWAEFGRACHIAMRHAEMARLRVRRAEALVELAALTGRPDSREVH